jgi:glycosyltransferase involved in cell wall biosynthesis
MRVLLDTTYGRRAPFSGTAIYLARLVKALAELPELELLPAANPRRRPPAGGGVASVVNLGADTWWTAIGLQRAARRERAQLVHHPIPALAPLARRPQVITVLDLAFERLPDHFDAGYRTYAHHVHRAAARAAKAVICISETTAADVRELWGVAPERIVVARLGPGQELAALNRPPAAEPAHFLYVGDAERRKNLGVLLAAYRRYRATVSAPLPLVLAGSARADQPGVRTVVAPSRERLAELFSEAAALVHPSLYEGFGLTPLEAMSVGTPVIAARSPGIVEVCDTAARYADPRDADGFAAAMAEIAADPAARAELRSAGSARAAEFSWSQCARRHADAYDLAVRA